MAPTTMFGMKVALQACLLWRFVEGLEDCPSKPSITHSLDPDNKPFLITSPEYKAWITSKREYLN